MVKRYFPLRIKFAIKLFPTLLIFFSVQTIYSCKSNSKLPEIHELTLRKEKMDLPVRVAAINELARYPAPKTETLISSIAFGKPVTITWRSEDNGPVINFVSSKISATQESVYEWEVVRWDSGRREQVSLPFIPQPPELSSPVTLSGESSILYFFTGPFIPSKTRWIESMGVKTPAKVAEAIWVYDFNGKLIFRHGIDTSVHSFGNSFGMLPLERNAGSKVFLKDSNRIEVKLGDITHLIERWAEFDVTTGELYPLDDFIRRANGGNLTGYSQLNNWYFFYDKLSDPDNPATIIIAGRSTVKLPPYQNPDISNNQKQALNVTNDIPFVTFNNSSIFLCNQAKTKEGIFVVALRMENGEIQKSKPTIIWEQALPEIFKETIVVKDPEDNRPYIVCLDSQKGDITVFDPLLGIIRAQSKVQLGKQTHPPKPGAHFCIPESSLIHPATDIDNPPGKVLIHDPRGEELILVGLSFRNPRTSSS